MEKGDIGAGRIPRYLFVFEDTLARLPNDDIIMSKLSEKLHAWDRLAGYWEVNVEALHVVEDHAWRQGVRCDVVTFLYGQNFARALLKNFEEIGAPVNGASYEISAGRLGRRLAHMPDVLAVYDGSKRRLWSYGPRARLLAVPSGH